MDFELSQEQLQIKDEVKEFCEKEFRPEVAIEFERKEEYPIEIYRRAAKLGLTCISVPKEYGGRGLGFFESCLVVEEMCKADSTLGVAVSTGNYGSDLILTYGTEEQKERYLPPICRGEYLSSAAFTEPDTGSDITHIKTTALRFGKEWRLNGTKSFILNAPLANFIVVLAQTDIDANPPYKGETLFVVEKDTPGLFVKNQSGKVGIRCCVTGEVTLKDVRVTDWNLVGELNKGFYNALSFLDKYRVFVAAQATGMAQGAWEIAFKYAKGKHIEGQPLLHHQAIGFPLAEIATKVEAARLLTYKAAKLIDMNRMDPMLSAMAKLYASRVAVEATDFAIQTLGGKGYFSEYRVERYHRDAKVTEIYEGTSEIQRLTILKYLIKRF
ncbi:MAG: acyl-CoA dehydrogenase family protein [Nitrososphaerales archaeon]|nr:acyl-CoA dehydrogenase family protein [Nitrososphaerales archaeon]